MAVSPAGSILRFGEKVSRVLDEGNFKLKTLVCLPSEPSSLKALCDSLAGIPHALTSALQSQVLSRSCEPPVQCSPSSIRLGLQVTTEEQFQRGGCRDAVIVREATKAVIAEFTPEIASELRLTGTALSQNLEKFMEQFVEMRKLVAIRMEVGDVSKQADERSMRIQDRIERAEHKAAVMKEALQTARLNRQKEVANVADQILKLTAEISDVKAKGSDNETALNAYTGQQTVALTSSHESKAGEFEADLAKTQAEFAKLAEANEGTAANLRKKRNHLRAEYSRVLADFDRDMADVSEKILKVNELMNKELDQLNILRTHFALVDLDNKAKTEEEAAERRKKESERIRRDARRIPAIRKLQRWYRKVLELRAYEKKKNKSKGPAGKSKKKK